MLTSPNRTTGRILDWLTTWHPAEMAAADLAPDPGIDAAPADVGAARAANGQFATPEPGMAGTDAAVQAAAAQFAPDQQQAPTAPWEGKTAEEVWRNAEPFKADLDKVKAATKDWREVAQSLGPDNSAAVVAFGRALAAQDRTAVASFRDDLNRILGEDAAPAPDTQQAPAAESDFDPFNPEQIDQRATAAVEKALAADRAKAAQDRAVEQVQSHVKSLAAAEGPDGSGGVGIPELGDPASWQYRAVLSIAQSLDDGDPLARLTNAARTLRDEIGKAGQQLLAAKRQQTVTPASPQNGASPSGQQEPQDFDKARASAKERLALRQRSPGT